MKGNPASEKSMGEIALEKALKTADAIDSAGGKIRETLVDPLTSGLPKLESFSD